MRREERRESLTYKSFFIQTWPMGHIVYGGQLFTLKMNFWAQMVFESLFGPKGSRIDRMDISSSNQAQLSPRKAKVKSMIDAHERV